MGLNFKLLLFVTEAVLLLMFCSLSLSVYLCAVCLTSGWRED